MLLCLFKAHAPSSLADFADADAAPFSRWKPNYIADYF